MTAKVVDLFSGGGGASAGFAATRGFAIVGAADAQIGKPSTARGKLSCNDTYRSNLGISPVDADLGTISPADLAARMGLRDSPQVLIACPPCTGFSRTNAQNHVRDDARNALVPRVGEFVEAWGPSVLVMENARELVKGRFRRHLDQLSDRLRHLGYTVTAETHFLNEFGLPQKRERALIIATSRGKQHLTMADLWRGLAVDPKATHTRRVLWDLPELPNGGRDRDDPMHVAPRIRSAATLARTRAIPQDGGSWIDLVGHPDSHRLLTAAMKDRLRRGAVGSHPDVYGRMWWDRPAPTIKRECGHVGNGRYTHPSQDRLCSVREMACLNGFPSDYVFHGSVGNSYRHIGDAVPPLISYQLAALVGWVLGGSRPAAEDLLMPNTHLAPGDIRPVG